MWFSSCVVCFVIICTTASHYRPCGLRTQDDHLTLASSWPCVQCPVLSLSMSSQSTLIRTGVILKHTSNFTGVFSDTDEIREQLQTQMRALLRVLLLVHHACCLLLPLGSQDTFGVICGTYESVAYFPVVVNESSRKLSTRAFSLLKASTFYQHYYS